MARLGFLFVSSMIFALTALLLSLGACSSGSQVVQLHPPPASSYTLTAATLNPGSITAGGTSSSAITVTPAAGYSGSVTLSCAKITGNTAPTCSFSTNPVTVTSGAAGSSTLTVTTTSNTPGGTYSISVTGSDANSIAPSNGSQALSLVTAAMFQHIVVIFQENRSPDNLFQDPVLINNGADIHNTANSFGTTIPLSPIDLGIGRRQPHRITT